MLGNILGSIASSVLSGGNSNQSTAMQLIQTLLQSQGGIEGLIAKFQQGGLDDLLKSWIGTGENKPVSGEQINNVFGSDLQTAAQEVGVQEHEAGNILAEFLPKIVDTLTPNGQIPDVNGNGLDANDLIAAAAKNVLGKFFS